MIFSLYTLNLNLTGSITYVKQAFLFLSKANKNSNGFMSQKLSVNVQVIYNNHSIPFKQTILRRKVSKSQIVTLKPFYLESLTWFTFLYVLHNLSEKLWMWLAWNQRLFLHSFVVAIVIVCIWKREMFYAIWSK